MEQVFQQVIESCVHNNEMEQHGLEFESYRRDMVNLQESMGLFCRPPNRMALREFSRRFVSDVFAIVSFWEA